MPLRKKLRVASVLFGRVLFLMRILLERQVLSSMAANHFRSSILAPVSARAATLLTATRRKYPAGIRVNRVMVSDERH